MSIKVRCGGDLGERERDLLACLPAANIEEATSVCTGGSNMPPAYCDLIFESRILKQKQQRGKNSLLFLNYNAIFDTRCKRLQSCIKIQPKTIRTMFHHFC